jgi:hypothetical protein
MAVQFRPGFIGGNPLTATTVTVVPDTIVTSGLILHLDASNPASYPGSGTTWTDLSGAGNNGTTFNGITFNSSNGGSLSFDGVDDYVQLPTAILAGLSEATVCAFIYPVSVDGGAIFSEGGSSTSVNRWQYNLTTSIWWTRDTSTGGDGVRNNDLAVNFLTPNAWNFVTAVYSVSGSIKRFYVNAVQRATTSVSVDQLTTTRVPFNTFLGRPTDPADVTDNYFNGRMAAVQVYRRSLTLDEIQQNYRATRSRFLGYQSITYTATANVTLTNNGSPAVTMFKNTDNGVWNGEVRSTESFTAPCTIEFSKQAGATDNGVSYAMIGWNEDPTANTSYTSLDYASYPYTTNTYSVYHNGSQVLFSGAWDPNKRFYVVYDTDGFIRHYNGSTLLYSVSYGTGKTVFVDSSFYSVNATTGGFTDVQVSRSSWNGAGYT